MMRYTYEQLAAWLEAGHRICGAAGVRGNDQSPIVTQRYLNTASYAGDPTPGAVVQTSDVSGSIIQSYAGQLGGILTLDRSAANYYTDPASAQLYPGDYQYVQFDPNDTAAAAIQGQVVWWVNNTTNLLTDRYRVTNANAQCVIAGIALCNTGKGKYWFIQVSGVAQVKFSSSLGATTPAVCDLVFADYANGTSFAYDPLQTTNNFTAAQLKVVLGIAWSSVPAALAISPVMLGGLSGPKYVPGGGGGEG